MENRGPLFGPVQDFGVATVNGHNYGYKVRRIGRHFYWFVWNFNVAKPAERGVQVYRIVRAGETERVHSFGLRIRRLS